MDWQNTTFEISNAHPHTAILPLATLEKHGAHLPVGTDWAIVNAIARQTADALGEGVYLLPTMPFGASANFAGTPGTVWLSSLTLMHVVKDVVKSLLDHGIHRVAVINNHGGAGESTVRPQENFMVKTAVRQLNYEYPDLQAIWVQPFTVARDDLLRLLPSATEEVHAGALETSVLLHLAGDKVKGRGVDYLPDLSKEYLDYLPFSTISPSGVWGHPSVASASLGKEILDAAVRGTVNYINESFEHLARIRG